MLFFAQNERVDLFPPQIKVDGLHFIGRGVNFYINAKNMFAPGQALGKPSNKQAVFNLTFTVQIKVSFYAYTT